MQYIRQQLAKKEPELAWAESVYTDASRPALLMISGLAAGHFVQRTWYKHYAQQGLDIALYNNHSCLNMLLQCITRLPLEKPLVLLGYSQGGFQIIKLAQRLAKQCPNRRITLMVCVAMGGLGHVYPAQWFASPRKIPTTVNTLFNVYSQGDILGTNVYLSSQALPDNGVTRIHNYLLEGSDRLSHTDIMRVDDVRFGSVWQQRIVPYIDQLIWES